MYIELLPNLLLIHIDYRQIFIFNFEFLALFDETIMNWRN